MNIHSLAADIASRIREMQADSVTNNAEVIERLILAELDGAPAELERLKDGMCSLQELHATPGMMELTLKQRPDLQQFIAQSLAEMVRASENYTEMKFDIVADRDKEVPMWITVTVQKASGKTPHQKRQEVEAILSKTLDALDSYGREYPDAPSAAEAALKDLNSFRIATFAMSKALCDLWDDGIIDHDKFCPEDDTCVCDLATLVNEAYKRLGRECLA